MDPVIQNGESNAMRPAVSTLISIRNGMTLSIRSEMIAMAIGMSLIEICRIATGRREDGQIQH